MAESLNPWRSQSAERHAIPTYHDTPEDIENSGAHDRLMTGSRRGRRKLVDDGDDEYTGPLPAFMARLPAAAAQRRRTILFAGLGVVAFVLLVMFFKSLQPPRGFSKKDFSACFPDKDMECGFISPAVACFPSIADDQIFRANTPLNRGFEVPLNIDASGTRASILTQMRDWMSARKALFEVCQSAPGSEDLVYMSTTTVARDIDYMATALDGAGSMINYLGLSYGTILGSYLVNMFPDRVGRVVIDGVVDPQKWAHEPAHTWLDTWMNSTELAYNYLLSLCGSVGPEECPLARIKGESSDDIGARVDGFLGKLYNESANVSHDPRRGVITSGMVRTLIYTSLVSPGWFPQVANAISSAMKGDYSVLAQLTMQPIKQPSHPLPGDHARSIIACLDSPPYSTDRMDTWPTAESLTDAALARVTSVSPRFGLAPVVTEPDGACHYLAKTTSRLPERFTGPFHRKLRNPILIVNGDIDPLTPLISARFVNNQLGNSARLVIQRNTPAHTSFWLGPSLCVARAYRRFFVSGLVPEAKETLCSSDMPVFNSPDASAVQNAAPPKSSDSEPDVELKSVAGERAPLLPRTRVPDAEAASVTDAPPWSQKKRWVVISVSFLGLLAFVAIFNDWPPQGLDRQGFVPCAYDTDFECGYIRVPRNYFNASEGETEVYIARYPAPDQGKRIGSLFINAGGPGNPASSLALMMGKPFSRMFEGRFDIAGRAVIEAQNAEWLALLKATFETCIDAPGSDDIKYMSSATVARDIDYMTTVLDGKDALINYWGPSYGSVLGQYLVNMFPDRVGRVAIDGVVDAHMWSNEPSHMWLASMLDAAEANYEYVIKKCGEVGPEYCALANTKGESHTKIIARVDDFLDQLYDAPASAPHAPRPGIITSGAVRALLYSRTSMPKHLTRAYEAIAAGMEGNYTQLGELTIAPIRDPPARLPGDIARQLISCMDQHPYNSDHPETWPTAKDLTDAALYGLKHVSPRFALSVSLQEPDGGCQFLARVVNQIPERFSGPFNHTLLNPILIANGDLDPITPLLHARIVNKRFGDSARLVVSQDTPAHSNWFAGPSMCIAKAYRNFYARGELPEENETWCPTDIAVFDVPSSVDPPDEDQEDTELRAAVMEIREIWRNFLPDGFDM
ncbi:hypothetical protein AURDEDRAFT_170010 [Auricularia subglabra TFB-10046 SS5]|uniref:Peptidase S33 tripeptidyl aminopeptidase-like C-terminal domain-containing protein n=1 Tax=Auricularia subglabra (strain TFB-10046 / SS5) TaxID=717982 RepID=J0WWN6_AURST|nr:hypothetical protein AURDEDRAFT_170010 [Auricularia subglabra TFB-10046 SS5]